MKGRPPDHPRLSSTIRSLPVLLAILTLAGCPKPSPETPTQETTPPESSPVAHDVAPTTKLRADLGPLYDLIVEKRTGAARVRLHKLLTVRPDDGQAAFLFGLSYHREKRYALARPYFESARADAPGYAVTEYFLGWCLYYLGEADLARAAFSAHLAVTPDEGDTHFGLGLLDLDDDRIDDAERRFRTAIAMSVDRPDRVKELSKSHALLGEVLMRRGAWDDARIELETSTRLYPDHYSAFYRLYRVQLRLGSADSAEAAKQEFLAARQRVYPETRFPE